MRVTKELQVRDKYSSSADGLLKTFVYRNITKAAMRFCICSRCTKLHTDRSFRSVLRVTEQSSEVVTKITPTRRS